MYLLYFTAASFWVSISSVLEGRAALIIFCSDQLNPEPALALEKYGVIALF